MRKHIGYGVFKGPMYQQGYGLGGYFSRFFKWLVPIAQKHIVPHLKSGIERIGREGTETIAKLAQDAFANRNLKDSSKEHLNQAVNNLKQSFEDTLEGKGVKKKIKRIVYKKARIKDIFHLKK
jgi:hypothetical protein